jgi:hypothetical protein
MHDGSAQPCAIHVEILASMMMLAHLHDAVARVPSRLCCFLTADCGVYRVQGLEDASESADDRAQAKVCIEN